MATITTLYRSRLAKERGTIKKEWGSRISVALVYPNYYQVGMSNLGFQAVHGLLNDHPSVVSERVFLPEEDELSIYKRRDHPLLSLESQTPLTEFDLIAFSLSFENDYPNVLTILELGKVPLLSSERDENYPLVGAGGVATFMNPEPLARFMDFFLLGEAEVLLKGFLEHLLALHSSRETKEGILRVLAQEIEGLYCPSLYRVTYKEDGTIGSFEPVLPSVPHKVKVAKGTTTAGSPCVSRIITPSTEFADTTLIELSRGCGMGCRFCAAGYVYRPPRIAEQAEVKASLDEVLSRNRRVGLISSSVSDVPNIEALTSYILSRDGEFSVSSLRASSLTRAFIEDLQETGQKTLTMAIETGSERLRKVINKKLTRQEILEAISLIARTGFFHLKLYFMIGLPTETRDDVKDIIGLIKSVRHHLIKESKGRKRIGRLRLNVNCFVPKAFTPFQWSPMDMVDSLKEKQRLLKRALSGEGGVRISFDVPKWAYLQTLFAMGDRRVGRMLLSTHLNGGNWKQTFRSSEMNPDFFTYRTKDLNERLPWDFIDHHMDKSYLQEEYRRALAAIESPACDTEHCTRCGVCPVPI
jgi:radical SAM superfamily enzyme YgiQ (UPF0313 family)